MWGTGDLGRLSRTVAPLSAGQISRRVRLRAQRTALDRSSLARRWALAGPKPGPGAGWPAGFTPLDARVWRGWPGLTPLRAGQMQLLGTTRVLAPAAGPDQAAWADADWAMPDAALLWRYHLHYWDWAWALAGERRKTEARARFGQLWTSWREATVPGQGVPWRPYPAALRAWAFCGLHRSLVADSEIEAPFVAALAAYPGFLRRHLETDVGGNHLIKDLKALIGLAVFFGDDQLRRWSTGLLVDQLAVQVLPDGGHYERAPAYHCQVLADLIDVAGLLRAAGYDEPAALPDTIGRMRRWLAAVLTPGGDVPLLNDGFPVSAELVTGLRAAAPPAAAVCELPDTGLARAVSGPWYLLADVGRPSPDELPAHAHADTLSCLVHVDKEPLLVDTGTSTYAAGPVRDHERSTAAHNTVEIDHQNSTEVWGAFRAGRRARVSGLATGERDGTVTIEAGHDGYRHLRGHPRHRRRWTLTGQQLQVDDDVTGRGRHQLTVRWHLAPGAQLRLMPGGASVTTSAGEIEALVTASTPLAVQAETAEISTGFGQTTAAPVLVCRLDATLPVRVSTTWRQTDRQETA
jgi:uncharacterized heparinase superfamily protein